MPEFEEGNKWWNKRSKHGRDAIFSSPEDMWEAACEYFEETESRPWYKNEAIKSGDAVGQIIEVPTSTPFTLHGLCLFWGVHTQYLTDFVKSKTYEENPDFSLVVNRIKETIYKQKFEGAAVGAYNSSIIARDLGLADKTEQSGTVVNHNVSLSQEDIENLRKKIDNDY